MEALSHLQENNFLLVEVHDSMAPWRTQVQACMYFVIHSMNGDLTIPLQEVLGKMDQIWQGKPINN